METSLHYWVEREHSDEDGGINSNNNKIIAALMYCVRIISSKPPINPMKQVRPLPAFHRKGN